MGHLTCLANVMQTAQRRRILSITAQGGDRRSLAAFMGREIEARIIRALWLVRFMRALMLDHLFQASMTQL